MLVLADFLLHPANNAAGRLPMSSPYQGQSTPKTAFLLASAVGWLIVGAVLIYLVPAGLNTFRPSDTSAIWMETLGRSGYNPRLAAIAGAIAFALTVIGNAAWYQFGGEQKFGTAGKNRGTSGEGS